MSIATAAAHFARMMMPMPAPSAINPTVMSPTSGRDPMSEDHSVLIAPMYITQTGATADPADPTSPRRHGITSASTAA